MLRALRARKRSFLIKIPLRGIGGTAPNLNFDGKSKILYPHRRSLGGFAGGGTKAGGDHNHTREPPPLGGTGAAWGLGGSGAQPQHKNEPSFCTIK